MVDPAAPFVVRTDRLPPPPARPATSPHPVRCTFFDPTYFAARTRMSAGFTFGDEAAPVPPPAVVPAVAPARGLTFNQILTLIVVAGALFFGSKVLDRMLPVAPTTPTATDMPRLAKVYGPELLAAFGDGCLDAGSTIGSGKSMVEGQAALQERFKTSRTAAFMVRINPELSKVIGEGAEPRDAAQRADVAKFWTDLGHACKGTK